jgi:hypothetical protein
MSDSDYQDPCDCFYNEDINLRDVDELIIISKKKVLHKKFKMTREGRV